MASFEETLHRISSTYKDVTFGVRPNHSEIIFVGRPQGHDIICACLHMYELPSMGRYTQTVVQINGNAYEDQSHGFTEFCVMTSRFPTLSIAVLYQKGSPAAKSLRRTLRQIHEAWRLKNQPIVRVELKPKEKKKGAGAGKRSAPAAQNVSEQPAPQHAEAAPSVPSSVQHVVDRQATRPPRIPSLEPTKFIAPPLPPDVDCL